MICHFLTNNYFLKNSLKSWKLIPLEGNKKVFYKYKRKNIYIKYIYKIYNKVKNEY